MCSLDARTVPFVPVLMRLIIPEIEPECWNPLVPVPMLSTSLYFLWQVHLWIQSQVCCSRQADLAGLISVGSSLSSNLTTRWGPTSHRHLGT